MTTLFYKDYNSVTLFFFFYPTHTLTQLEFKNLALQKTRDETRRILVFFLDVKDATATLLMPVQESQGKPRETRQAGNQAARQPGSKAARQQGNMTRWQSG